MKHDRQTDRQTLAENIFLVTANNRTYLAWLRPPTINTHSEVNRDC